MYIYQYMQVVLTQGEGVALYPDADCLEARHEALRHRGLHRYNGGVLAARTEDLLSMPQGFRRRFGSRVGWISR